MKCFLFIICAFISACASHPIDYLQNKKCYPFVCMYQAGENPDKTLVYFPGMLDSKKSLEKSIFDISDIREVIEGMKPVKVIVYSEAKLPEKIAYFIKEPQNIDRALVGAPGPIYGIGHSMGGYNLAAYVGMRPDKMKKIALINAMLLKTEKNPYNLFSGPALVFKNHFSKNEWAKLNPSYLANIALTYPETLISNCKADIWDLEPAGKSLFDLLVAKGFKAEFQENKPGCGHPDIPGQMILEYFKK